MEIDRAADQADLNRLNAESTRRLQGAQAGYYEREVSISKYLPDLRVAIKKGPGALTEGKKTLAMLGIEYGTPGWEIKFSTAYLKELGFSDDQIAAALMAESGGPGGGEIITEAEL